MRLEGKVVIAQGGGPTAVINQSLVGAVLESRKYPQITKVYGAVNGACIVNEDFLDLTQETTHNLEEVALTPSSGLLSTRDKPDEAYCSEILKVLAHDVRYFFYIGGNDSSDTVRIVNEHAKSNYDFRQFISQNHRQRFDGQRPYPRLWLCRKVCSSGIYGYQPGQ